jgi:hypothetical protein
LPRTNTLAYYEKSVNYGRKKFYSTGPWRAEERKEERLKMFFSILTEFLKFELGEAQHGWGFVLPGKSKWTRRFKQQSHQFFHHFISRGWIRTPDFRMMRRVFYHCATAAGKGIFFAVM